MRTAHPAIHIVMYKYALEAIGIGKRFGALKALDDVSLRLKSGSFHALLGENGAGKSTLVKCIMGYYTPDAGQLLVEGRQQIITNPRDAHQFGLGMVYQHFTLIPNMTVLENLVLSRPRLPARIDWRAEHRQIQERMSLLPFSLPLDAPVRSLAAGEKQKLEIIKQLLLRTRILILDEPTSVLTPSEADEVLGQLRDLTRRGELSVLIITHKFREVMSYADEVTVLRKGRLAGAAGVESVDVRRLAEMMVGAEFVAKPVARATVAGGEIKLEVDDLHVEDDIRNPAVRGVSLRVRGGEILGIAGVSGNGQRELVEALSGQRAAKQGSIRLHGEAYTARRGEMRRHGFHCLPEEPLRNACVPAMSVAENLAFRRFDRSPFTTHGPWLRRRAMLRAARELIQRFKIRAPGPAAPIGELSGGNVQRSVLARELADEVDVLVVANPCFGLDLVAVTEVHARLVEARNRGAAVLLVSEDLDEVLELSDRVVVMAGGRLVHETTPQLADIHTIGRSMAGH